MKVVVLGGSSVASPALVLALTRSSLQDMEVVLVGRSAEKLGVVGRACAIAAGPHVRVTTSTAPEQAMAGADAILNQVRVGGLAAREFDETYPTQFGLIGEETLGAGGFFNALRTIPVVLQYARMAEREAPDAWFINVTNPAGMVASAVHRTTKLKTFSVCDVPGTLLAGLQETLGSDLEWDWLGVNHVGWLTGLRRRGTDQSLMGEAIDAAARWPLSLFAVEDVCAMQAIPSPYVRYLLYPHRYRPQSSQSRSRATDLKELEAELLQQYRTLSAASPSSAASLVQRRGAHWYDQAVVPVLEALFRDNPKTMMLQIPDRDTALERPVQVSRSGIAVRPPWAPIPQDAAAWLGILRAYESLAVEAILTGERAKAIRALGINPLVGDGDIARQLLAAVWRDSR